MKSIEDINAAYDYIAQKTNYNPTIGIILGSGLGKLASEIKDAEIYNYKDIPNFPISTVKGHNGRLLIGRFQNKIVLAMEGRFHYYEGYDMSDITLPIRVIRLLGVNTLLITNAAGAVNTDFYPGDLMIIKDHINLSGNNPLIGQNLSDRKSTRLNSSH